MATFVNYLNCTTSAGKGTGSVACELSTGIPDGFILVPKTWSIDPAVVDFDAAYIKTKIQEREFHPFLDAVDFAENSEETVFKTYNTGISAPVRKGLPQLDFIYNNGYCFHTAATSFDSFDKYNIILTWKNEVLGAAYKADGVTLTGLDCGYVDTATYKNNNGTDPAETMIKIQLKNSTQYNGRMALLSAAENNIDFLDINGIVECKMLVDLPLDTATTVSVSVKAECNSSINVLGLTDTNFIVTGKTVSAAVYNATTEKYDLTTTAFASGDVFTISLTDGVYSNVEIASVIYTGESTQLTVA